jgi:cytochrome c biogenesis protein CcdA
MARVGAAFLICWGILELINEFFPAFPIKLKIPQSAHMKMAVLMEKASVPTSFLLGGLVGLYEFPCTGGPYLMALGLLHDHATHLKGLGYLAYYNFVFVLPLIIILLIASNKVLLEKVQNWRKAETRAARLWGGTAMIILGLAIFFF